MLSLQICLYLDADVCADPSLPLLPSEPSQGTRTRKRKNALGKELTLLSTTALIINQTVGSGIFITPSSVLQNAGSFGLSITLWAVGGVAVYFACFCYLELALLVKKSGSTYIYVTEAFSFGRSKPWMETFGSMFGFLMVWTDIMIGQPVGIAVVLLSMGHYLCQPFFIDCQEMSINAVKMFAMFALSM